MKVLTIQQPHATLVAIQEKRIETRSWWTAYRGPLAIHAAKGCTFETIRLFFKEPFRSTFDKAGYKLFSLLPRGAIIATCELIGCEKMLFKAGKCLGFSGTDAGGLMHKFEITDQERWFGYYAPGRYAWLIANVQLLPKPVPAKGALGLWNFNLEAANSTIALF